jgi:FkbM family methyltransferase
MGIIFDKGRSIMTSYLNSKFVENIDKTKINTIIELGTREGNDAKALCNFYQTADIHAFECNPNMLNTTRLNLKDIDRISLHEVAVGEVNDNIDFYPATNPGASSIFEKAILGNWWGNLTKCKVDCVRLDDYLPSIGVTSVDLICADIQGGEMGALKGMSNMIKDTKYIILETPKNNPTYEGAPSKDDIYIFMEHLSFIPVVVVSENNVEENVLFKNNTET